MLLPSPEHTVRRSRIFSQSWPEGATVCPVVESPSWQDFWHSLLRWFLSSTGLKRALHCFTYHPAHLLKFLITMFSWTQCNRIWDFHTHLFWLIPPSPASILSFFAPVPHSTLPPPCVSLSFSFTICGEGMSDVPLVFKFHGTQGSSGQQAQLLDCRASHVLL